MSGIRVHGILNLQNTVINQLFYHQMEKILQKYKNMNTLSYAGNERVKVLLGTARSLVRIAKYYRVGSGNRTIFFSFSTKT